MGLYRASNHHDDRTSNENALINEVEVADPYSADAHIVPGGDVGAACRARPLLPLVFMSLRGHMWNARRSQQRNQRIFREDYHDRGSPAYMR